MISYDFEKEKWVYQKGSNSLSKFYKSRECQFWGGTDEFTAGQTMRLYPMLPGTKVTDNLLRKEWRDAARKYSKKTGECYQVSKLLILKRYMDMVKDHEERKNESE